jgi:predicted RNase H-like nuclease (RuvC/YqgF family)
MSEEKNHIENIQQIIDDLAQTNSFSAGAMAQFTQMKEELDSAERTIKYLRKGNDTAHGEIADLKDQIRAKDEEISRMYGIESGWIQRESELQDREAQITRLEMTAENESRRVTDHSYSATPSSGAR